MNQKIAADVFRAACLIKTFFHEVDEALTRTQIDVIECEIRAQLSTLTPTGIHPDAYATLRLKLLGELAAKLVTISDVELAEAELKRAAPRIGMGTVAEADKDDEDRYVGPTIEEIIERLDDSSRVREAADLLVVEYLCRCLREDACENVGRSIQEELKALRVRANREARAQCLQAGRALNREMLEQAHSFLALAKKAVEAKSLDVREVGWRLTEANALLHVYHRTSLSAVKHDNASKIEVCLAADFDADRRIMLDKRLFWPGRIVSVQRRLDALIGRLSAGKQTSEPAAAAARS